MNSTPNLPANNGSNGQNGTSKNGSTFGITPGEVVNLSDVIKNVKGEQTPGEVKQPTTYPTPKPEPAEKAPEAPAAEAPKATKAEPTTKAPQKPAPAAPPVAPEVQPEAVKRSRSEEITFQIEKAQKLQSINTQLVSLRGKLADLKQFSYRVDEDDNHSYGRLAIYDDANHEFTCKHHGLSEMVVEFLMSKFETKIEEKENELLAVSAW